ncbi:MAG: FHA domain-containing protein [Kofleriaceae bacterium]
MLRIEVSEDGRPPLPAIDLDDARFVIGSGSTARIRLPAAAARAEHVVIDSNAAGGGTWRSAEGSGALGAGHTFQIASYRVRVAPAPVGTRPTPPQRTESLARELLRGMLGADGAPSLTVERGPLAGSKRALPPPEAALVIGRGDDAQWIFDDPDLSKRHVEIRRSWDGVRAVDLESKNGTRLDGRPLGEAELRDGSLLELGKLALRYRDPAERHLGEPAPPVAEPTRTPPVRGGRTVFVIALVVAALALAGIVALVVR